MKNNAYKKIRQIVSLFMFSILSIGFIIGCSEPEDIKPDMPVMTKAVCEEYLSIDNFADLVAEAEASGTGLNLTPQEDEILFKVFDRIFENLASVDGKPDFSSISAESLNMDDDLFNITLDALRPYITGEKIIGENVQNVKNTNDKLLRIPRMKSKSESGSDLGDGWYMGGGNSGNTGGGNEGGNMGFGGGGYIPPTTYDPWPVEMVLKFLNATISKDAMFGHICKVFNLSDFEEKCFSQYWYAKGDLYLDENDWQGIKRIAESFVQQNDWESLKKKIGKNSMNIEITAQGDTIQYYKQVINFYDYDNYNYALGSSTINFTEEGQAVGLYDVYDFNYGVEIKRDEWDNAITIAAGVIGELYGAVSYIMIYGIF